MSSKLWKQSKLLFCFDNSESWCSVYSLTHTSPCFSRYQYPYPSYKLRKEKPTRPHKLLRAGHSLGFKQVFFSLLQFSSGFISFFFFHIKLCFKSFSLLFDLCLHLYHLVRGNFLFAFWRDSENKLIHRTIRHPVYHSIFSKFRFITCI